MGRIRPDWITSRPPTDVDADCDLDVIVQTTPGTDDYQYRTWNKVEPGQAWRYTDQWRPPQDQPYDSVTDVQLEHQFRQWWPYPAPPGPHALMTHVAWGRHLLGYSQKVEQPR